MKHFTLAVVVSSFGFSLSDVDVLVKNKHAQYGSKSGKTTLVMDVEAATDYLIAYHEARKYHR